MATTDRNGNMFTQQPSKTADKQFLVLTSQVQATTNNTNKKFAFGRIPTDAARKYRLVSFTWSNGITATVVNTVATVVLKNFTNASDAMATVTLDATNKLGSGDANYAPGAGTVTAVGTTSDRSATAGGSATEPDANGLPGDVLIVHVTADAGSTVDIGTCSAVFRPLDIGELT